MDRMIENQIIARENFPKKSKWHIKRIITNSIVISLMAICLVLNIALLLSDVFKGTYSAKIDNLTRVEIRFYDNTFTQTEYHQQQNGGRRYGFYSCVEDNILLQYNGDTNSYRYTRENVFKLVNESGKKYYCVTAVFLQVLYIIDYLASTIILVVYNLPYILRSIQESTFSGERK